jgi:xanthine dehydrogenase accessory factor
MRDVLDSWERWQQAGEALAIATVVDTWGSSPRPTGSKMVVTAGGQVAGSVSAGCVEAAVIEAAQEVIATGAPQLLQYGVADDTAWEVGLACGGRIQIFVEPGLAWEGLLPALRRHLLQRESLAVVSVLAGPDELLGRKRILLERTISEAGLWETDPTLGNLPVGDDLRPAIRGLLENETPDTLASEDGGQYFVEIYPPAPRLILVGAVHLAEILVEIAGLAGFDTLVIDPRRAFATPQRFPHASALVYAWPQEALAGMALDRSAYVAVLTHDPKLDDPALQVALTSQARYVGALGSRRTHRLRVERLRQAGLSDDQIARLHAPIGIDLGGRSPGEIAVSILAEVIQARNQPFAPQDTL